MDTERKYQWGKAGRLRAARDYLGLGTVDMATRLGMARRSYQRMETGAAAIPESLWETVDGLIAEFDAQVRKFVNVATSSYPAGMPVTATVNEDAPAWERNVVARAVYAVPIPGLLDVKMPDDYKAEREMREE